MPANKTTRRGNGAGWGGPAQGEGKKGAVPGSGRPQGVKNGEGKKSVADLMIEAGARETAAERWLQILNDPKHPKHAEMVAKAAERMDGAPTQRNEISLRDVPADQLTDEELAAIASRSRRRTADAPEDQD